MGEIKHQTPELTDEAYFVDNTLNNDALPTPFTHDASPELDVLAERLVAAQKEITKAAKDGVNPHYKSKYSTLADVRDACMPALNKHNISVLQIPRPGSGVTLRTILLTATENCAQWIASDVSFQPEPGIHPLGSAITYLCRYSLAPFVGVSPEDDDGNAAQSAEPYTAKIPPECIEDGVVVACTFGKNKGTLWRDMSEAQLRFYASSSKDEATRSGALSVYQERFGDLPDE